MMAIISRKFDHRIFWTDLFFQLWGFFVVVVSETESCYVAQADLKLAIFLPQSPKNWNYWQCHYVWLSAGN
jgi:hypothetical protein